MQVGYHLYPGASLLKKYKIATPSITSAGIGIIGGNGAVSGVIKATTTNATEYIGLGLDTAVYSTTQGDAEGVLTVDFRPDTVVRALMCGGSTENTALTSCTNTSASSGGTTVTSASVQANDMKGGTAWFTSGGNVGMSRIITTHTASTSFVVTVPFPHAIAVGDIALMCPWGQHGDFAASSDGVYVQGTTLGTQADATIASGTGMATAVVDLELNGTTDSYVYFIFTDHVAYAGVLA